MLRLRVDLLLPRVSTADVRQRAAELPRRGQEVRVRVRGDVLVARRWVNGVHATGHSVLRARLTEEPDGVRVRGAVTPSELDLVMVATWLAAAGGLATLGAVYQSGVAWLVALIPLAFGAVFAAWLPGAARAGHDVLLRTLAGLGERADPDGLR
ncbi:hypothetical protein [Cellulosimicrobium protaetiae]|uniref:Uncharacterized protein n=1 Tax=Cellulosimicrobium protaetiae TaxID=2587808 RepID=A0A6M5UD81_9MICO|nr:hypothetical protein [Cellulosimicrobium protaetiae]QJW35301.1 hypothetical protein FIC82_002880 [Cellulosimicrobium protaetiae]